MIKFFSKRKTFAFYMWQVIGMVILSITIFFTHPIEVVATLESNLRAWHFDKIVHFVVFFMVTSVWLKMLTARDAPAFVAKIPFMSKIIGTCVLCVIGGGGVELIQGWLVYRQAALGDFYSHLLGSLVALILFLRSGLVAKHPASYLTLKIPSK